MECTEEQKKVIEIFKAILKDDELSRRAESYVDESAYSYPPSFFERRFNI